MGACYYKVSIPRQALIQHFSTGEVSIGNLIEMHGQILCYERPRCNEQPQWLQHHQREDQSNRKHGIVTVLSGLHPVLGGLDSVTELGGQLIPCTVKHNRD